MLRWLFPHTCELCGERSDTECSLCSRCCEERVPRVPKPACLYCGSPIYMTLDDPWACPQCAKQRRPFDFARSGFYGVPEMRKLMHRYKYGRETHFARSFARLMAELWETHPILSASDDWTLIPVPITPARYWHRRFNQSELLAQELIRLFPSFSLAQPLTRRVSEISSQTLLTAQQRSTHANSLYSLRSAFKSGRKGKLPSNNVVIIDDVYTTGSTLRACARQVLKIRDVEQLAVVTAMRAER